jgi:hypothetical protein
MLLAMPTAIPEPQTRKCWGFGSAVMPMSGLDMALKYGRSPGDHRATDALIDDISVCQKSVTRRKAPYPARVEPGSQSRKSVKASVWRARMGLWDGPEIRPIPR